MCLKDIDFVYRHPDATHGYSVEGLKEVVTLRDAIGDLEDNPGDYFTGSYSTISFLTPTKITRSLTCGTPYSAAFKSL